MMSFLKNFLQGEKSPEEQAKKRDMMMVGGEDCTDDEKESCDTPKGGCGGCGCHG